MQALHIKFAVKLLMQTVMRSLGELILYIYQLICYTHQV